jgi:hypothetical protein
MGFINSFRSKKNKKEAAIITQTSSHLLIEKIFNREEVDSQK